MEEIMLKIDHVSKRYKLGQIGGTTLRDELQRKRAKRRGQEDPTKKIGAADYEKGSTFMALEDINFEVKKGERIGIIGHNGAGKSTLLKLVSRITAPTDGTISLNGRVASMLEVGTGFHPELTGRENIYMNGAILGMTKKEIDSKMEDIIEFSECRKFIDTPVKRYSSGMYVKLAFAVAAHLDNEILIMDEVLAVGDTRFQEKCINKMLDVARSGRTVLYVSHNMRTIQQLCNRCIVLDHGHLIFDGEVEEAISYYIGNTAKQDVVYDMTKAEQNTGCDHIIDMHTLTLNDKQINVYQTGEPISCTLNFSSPNDYKEAIIRAIVLRRDEVRIGTAESKPFKIKAGDMNVRFTLDSSFIADGSYFVEVSVIEKISDTQYHKLEGYYNAFYFKIENAHLLPSTLMWNQGIYGNSVFPIMDAKVVK